MSSRLFSPSKSLDIIEEFYSKNCVDDFEAIKEEIIKKIEKILKRHAQNHNLMFSNSAYKGKYFSIKSRVKSPESLKEKLFRSSKLLQITKKYFEDENIISDEDELKKYFFSFGDCIGIKILGELNQDCIELHNILTIYEEQFNQEGITFEDIEKQPDTMKNGLSIFKINAQYESEKYSDKLNFEIQIKSQLESAWADMEHQIFYKDHRNSPIKNSTQSIMIRIGELLNNVDSLLLTIRNSKKNFENDAEFNDFSMQLQEFYSEKFKQHLNIKFDFNFLEVSHFLFQIKQKFLISDVSFNEEKNLIERKNFEKEEIFKNLKELKDQDFNLQLLELIGEHVISSDIKLDEFYLKFLIANCFDIQVEEIIIEDNILFYEVLSEILSTSNNSNVFLYSPKFNYLFKLYITVLDIYDEIPEQETDESETLKLLLMLYGYYKFNDIEHRISDLFRDIDKVLEVIDLISSVSVKLAQIRESKLKSKSKSNPDKEIEIIDNLEKDLLNINKNYLKELEVE